VPTIPESFIWLLFVGLVCASADAGSFVEKFWAKYGGASVAQKLVPIVAFIELDSMNPESFTLPSATIAPVFLCIRRGHQTGPPCLGLVD